MSSQAGMIAKTGFSMLYNATVTSVSAISDGLNKAYKSYQDHYEKSQVDSLKKAGKPPADVLHAVLMRFYYLSMAGYNNEAAAAAQKIAAKLITSASQEKSAVSLECVGALSSILVSTCSRHGDFMSSGWGLQDFLNSSRMGKDHFDRDQLVSDFYFAILYAQEIAGGPGPQFENYIRDAVGKMVEGENYVSGNSSGPAQGWAAYGSGGVPAYAKPQGAYGSTATKTSDPAHETDPKKRAAKVLSVVAQAVKKAVDDAEGRRVRNLKEAEEMLQRERAKAAQAGGAAPAAPGVSGFGGPSGFGGGSATGFGGSGGFGSGAGSGYGTTAKAPAPSSSGFGSATFGGYTASPAGGGATGFGGATASGFGSGSSGFGSASNSGFGGGSSSGWGSGSSSFGAFGSGGGGGYSSLNPSTSMPSGGPPNTGTKPGQSDWGSLI